MLITSAYAQSSGGASDFFIQLLPLIPSVGSHADLRLLHS
jgi:hypothetical protein